MAADDKLEAVLAHADAEEIRERSADADMVQDCLEDQYEATLAKAGMRAFHRSLDATEVAPEMTLIDDLPKANAAMAADDKLEVGFAFVATIDEQACPVREQSRAAALPQACSAMANDGKFEAVLACADRRDLQWRSDAAEDMMEQQLWAAGLPKACEDALEKDKLETCIDMQFLQNHSTTASDGFARRVSVEQGRAWVSLLLQLLPEWPPLIV